MYLLPLAIALGFKHAYDADHLAAVSNFLVRSPGIRNTSAMSLNWALGHTLTAGAITLLLYAAFSEAIVSSLSYFEIGVGAMLIVLGVLGIAWETGVPSRPSPPARENITRSLACPRFEASEALSSTPLRRWDYPRAREQR